MNRPIALALIALTLSGQSIQWRGPSQARGAVQIRGGAASSGIPAGFLDLYNFQNTALSGWTNYILAQWGAAGGDYYAPMLTGNELTTVDALLGLSAANTNQAFFDNQVTKQLNAICGQPLSTPNRSVGLGASIVKFLLGFPLLYPAYYTFDDGLGHTGPGMSLYNARLSIIQQAVAGAHDRGCSVVIQSQAAGAQGASINDPSLDFYYASLTWTEYKTGRAGNILNIAQLLAPDWICVSEEPDTEYNKTGQNYSELISTGASFGTNIIGMVTQIRDTLDAASIPGLHSTIKLSLGSGSWVPTATYNKFVPQYAALSGFEGFEIHVHPVNTWIAPPTTSPVSFLQRAITMCDLAIENGKVCTFNEQNIDKSRVSEQGSLDPTIIDARSVLSFWSPNEIIFYNGMIGLGHWKHAAFVSLARPQEMFYTVDYNACSACTCLPNGVVSGVQPCNSTQLNSITSASNAGQFAAISLVPPTLTANGLAAKALFAAGH